MLVVTMFFSFFIFLLQHTTIDNRNNRVCSSTQCVTDIGHYEIAILASIQHLLKGCSETAVVDPRRARTQAVTLVESQPLIPLGHSSSHVIIALQ